MEPPAVSSSLATFPVLAASIVGILFTLMLLLSYYVFVIRCCLDWQHSGAVLSRLSLLRRHRRWPEPSSAFHSASMGVDRGLDESTIQAIPTFRYRKRGESTEGRCGFQECAVCLNELQEDEKMRLLPNCFHVFHIDCIDVWLQKNDNCPVCRSSIRVSTQIPGDHRSTADMVAEHSDDLTGRALLTARNPSSSDQRRTAGRRELQHRITSSRGDECIEVRHKDGDFCVDQPVRRSFSMDSSRDRQLYVTLKKILQQNPHFQDVSGEIGGSSRRIRRSIFSLGRSSRAASVLPVQMEP